MPRSKKVQKDIEKKSRSGYVIKVRPQRSSFLIFRPDGNPERLYSRDPNRILNPLKTIAFIGHDFRLLPYFTGLSFLKVHRNRIIVPYKHSNFKKDRIIQIHTPSGSDLIPMNIEKINSIDELLQKLKTPIRLHYIVLEDSTGRSDVVKIKQRVPSSFLFLIKTQVDEMKNDEAGNEQEADDSKIRAMDTVPHEEKNLELYSDNPVFLGRIFLRNMQLAKMKSLLLEKPVTLRDNEFLQALLSMMIRNDAKSEELEKHKNELGLLKSFCEIQKLILENSLDEVINICEKEKDKEKLNFYSYLVKRYKKNAKNKDEEIQFWELGALLEKRLQEFQEKK